MNLTWPSRSTIYARIAEGLFPKLSPGGQAVGWRENEMLGWLAALQSKRESATLSRAITASSISGGMGERFMPTVLKTVDP